jgi:hypothetical protein
MHQPLPVLETDLLIEHGGRELKVSGSGSRFAVKFSSLLSFFHFVRIFWPYRKRIPGQASVELRFGRLSIPVRRPKRLSS